MSYADSPNKNWCPACNSMLRDDGTCANGHSPDRQSEIDKAHATISDFYLRALTSYHYQQPITRADLGAITDAADRLGIHLPKWTP